MVPSKIVDRHPSHYSADHGSIEIGTTRVQDVAGFRGTVRYVGPVVTSPSGPATIYAGIEWDDNTRGKHNGSVVDKSSNNLVAYFTTRHPTAGSFLKLNKLDFGIALTESVVYERYVVLASTECVAPDGKLPHSMPTTEGRPGKVVELVGEFHIRPYQQVERLRQVSLRLQRLRTIEMTGWDLLQHVIELDLAGNLFATWETVLPVLLGNLPQLEGLSLAANRLNDIVVEEDAASAQSNFPIHQSLRHLNIHTTNIQSVNTVAILCRALPFLEELTLAHNMLRGVDSKGSVESLFDSNPKLLHLDISDCQLDDDFLESVPSQLLTLRMDDNPNVTVLSPVLTRLQHLQISNTGFTQWPNVPDTLRRLRIRDVQFPIVGRLPILAHYPSVTHLNGSAVSSDQRKQAARWAVRNNVNVDYWQAEYPGELLLPQHSSNNASSPTTTVITVSLVSLAAASCTSPPLVRRLPLSLAVRDVKKLCMRQFGLQKPILQWSVTTPDQKDDISLPIPLQSNNTLVEVPDGATIWVRDEAEEEEGKTGTTDEALVRRIEQQEQEKNAFLKAQEKANGVKYS